MRHQPPRRPGAELGTAYGATGRRWFSAELLGFSRPVKAIRLANGQEIWGVNRRETSVLHREIFELGAYAQGGIQLHDGCQVFDVGANIGLFGVWLAGRLSYGRLAAFEPIPSTFAILSRNARDHMPGLDTTLYDVALSDQSGVANFTVDPLVSFTSSSHAADVDAAADRGASDRRWCDAVLADLAGTGIMPAWLARGLRARLDRPAILAAIRLVFVAAGLPRRLRRPIARPCRTASDMLDELHWDRLDLLKVDVEGAELSVVRGIRDEHWPLIRQAALEVHDVAGRLAELRALFERQGFRTSVVDPDFELLKLMRVGMLYAVRS